MLSPQQDEAHSFSAECTSTVRFTMLGGKQLTDHNSTSEASLYQYVWYVTLTLQRLQASSIPEDANERSEPSFGFNCVIASAVVSRVTDYVGAQSGSPVRRSTRSHQRRATN